MYGNLKKGTLKAEVESALLYFKDAASFLEKEFFAPV